MIENCLYIMLGGGIGSVLRYVLTRFMKNILNFRHYATFIVNMTGSFLLGVFATYFYGQEHSNQALFLIVGLIGSYTTFSTFEYENIDLLAHEKYIEFIKYSTYSCICGVICVGLGMLACQLFISI